MSPHDRPYFLVYTWVPPGFSELTFDLMVHRVVLARCVNVLSRVSPRDNQTTCFTLLIVLASQYELAHCFVI
jgi:hypothetical protein